MDKINPVSTNLLYVYKPQVNSHINVKNNSSQPVESDVVKKETADAIKAYSLVAPKANVIPEKKSIDELKTDLLSQGKVEGKDFTIRKGKYDSQLNIIENDKTVKVYRYMNNGEKKEDFDAIQEVSYPLDSSKGLKYVETMYGADGEFHFRASTYERDKSPYVNEIVNYDTQPYDLEQKLKSQSVKYSRDHEYSDVGDTVKITAFNPKTDEITRYEFSYRNDNNELNSVSKCIIDKEGALAAEIVFRKNDTRYTAFHNIIK